MKRVLSARELAEIPENERAMYIEAETVLERTDNLLGWSALAAILLGALATVWG